MRTSLFVACCLGLLASYHAEAADAAGAPVPDWLRGEWVVTKVYEANEVYPVSAGEPKVHYIGQTMTVEADSLHLTSEICAEATARDASAGFQDLIRRTTGQSTPSALGLGSTPGKINYLEITCGKSLMEDGSRNVERDIGRPIKWRVIRDADDKIEMPFFSGCFLELHRQKPTS
jgi:hypothetical protein